MSRLNDLILFRAAGIPVYASAAVITLGILLCVCMTLSLYRSRHRSVAAVLSLAVFGFVFGVVLSRILHWYFNAETYASFAVAMTDYSVGSFCLPGMLLGIWAAAWLTKLFGLTATMGELLDAAAPGTALLIAMIRLSSLFNTTCRSRILIRTPWLQFLPFAVADTDAAGNVSYRFATFFIEFLLMLVVMFVVLRFFQDKSERRMRRGCPRTGNAARLFTLLYAAVAVIMDSTRYDKPLMHFRFLSDLNQYSAFISLAQIFAGATVLGILIKYSVASVRANRLRWYHPLCWLLFPLSGFVIGKLGEYNVQRYATYLKCYAFMTVGCIGLVASAWLLYRSCVSRREFRR